MEEKDSSVAVKECMHEHVKYVRCFLHFGWCGTCLDCGKKVHARHDEFILYGKMTFRETMFHGGSQLN